MTIFIKPKTAYKKKDSIIERIFFGNNSETYYILTLFDETIPRLERVVFETDEPKIIDFIDECKLADDDRIFFDATVHFQTGKELREATDHHVRLYGDATQTNPNEKQSKASEMKIAAQASWIANNMQYSKKMQNDPHFHRFMQLVSEYDPTNPRCDPSAAELMAAAARYIRSF